MQYNTGIGQGDRVLYQYHFRGRIALLTEHGRVYIERDGQFMRYYRHWWERLMWWL